MSERKHLLKIIGINGSVSFRISQEPLCKCFAIPLYPHLSAQNVLAPAPLNKYVLNTQGFFFFSSWCHKLERTRETWTSIHVAEYSLLPQVLNSLKWNCIQFLWIHQGLFLRSPRWLQRTSADKDRQTCCRLTLPHVFCWKMHFKPQLQPPAPPAYLLHLHERNQQGMCKSSFSFFAPAWSVFKYWLSAHTESDLIFFCIKVNAV